jgi:hypothetical protein
MCPSSPGPYQGRGQARKIVPCYQTPAIERSMLLRKMSFFIYKKYNRKKNFRFEGAYLMLFDTLCRPLKRMRKLNFKKLCYNHSI